MKTIIVILKAHGIQTKQEGAKLFALEEYTIKGVYGFTWLDASDWDLKKTFEFLNY
jgi:hypothetical protein